MDFEIGIVGLKCGVWCSQPFLWPKQKAFMEASIKQFHI